MSDIVTTILVSAATSFSTKAIEGPIQTFNDIWKGSFGYKIQYWAESKRYSAEQNYKKYVSSIDEKVAKIKEENLQDPQLSIVGPALEASKYYIEEKEIREMFANLIASSMDSTYSGLVQHSFVEIIKQLSSQDAIFFKYLENVRILDEFRNEHSFFSEDFPNPQSNIISLNNLKRLGLIDIRYEYEVYNSTEKKRFFSIPTFSFNFTFRGARPSYLNRDNILDTKIYVYCYITEFGKAFKKVCIKDSL